MSSYEKCPLPDDIPEVIALEIEKRGGIKGLKNCLPEDECAKTQSKMHKACTDPVRLKILSLLKGGPLCVCAIKEVLELADSKLSYHLNVLKDAGLIEGYQQYRWVIYKLTEQGEIWMGCVCQSRNLMDSI
ncbi:winged helix-turn-helix transcriptional regulator [Methanoplanus sp. FWC-SCC4]|uniref:Winged helix-turn-helix transcriptional regulator n=1 Tax=Methanochimaera problematica TaxID=2609417 RepID=A0AA97FC69_9EURY|nr:metalloregulator ArsR/SmtB family transcription factor [Methanoplanus sp. FWC-SCC4]WOF16182.1 winged helix-turn-helix transcriptional regulator [Methanoplanus sp. FWC-SCC4]